MHLILELSKRRALRVLKHLVPCSIFFSTAMSMWNWNALSQHATQQNASSVPSAAAPPGPLLKRSLPPPPKRSVSARANLVASRATSTPSARARTTSANTNTNADTNTDTNTTGSATRATQAAARPPDDVEHFSKLRITKRTVPAADVTTELSARRFLPLQTLDTEPKSTFTDNTVRPSPYRKLHSVRASH